MQENGDASTGPSHIYQTRGKKNLQCSYNEFTLRCQYRLIFDMLDITDDGLAHRKEDVECAYDEMFMHVNC